MRQKWQTTSKEDKVAAIAGLASQGYSAAQIAAELEAPSRNAIIGLANRNGIRLHGTAKRRHDPDARGRVVNLPAAKTAVNKGRTPTGTAEVIQLKPKAKKKAPERKASPVKMMDVTNATCRRPLFKDPRGLHPDDMFFCGEVTAEESVWCKACRTIMTEGRSPSAGAIDKNGEPVKRGRQSTGGRVRTFDQWHP